MIQQINRGSDVSLVLNLKDAEGNPFRISDLNEFSMRFYTTNPDNYIEVSFRDGIYTGISSKEDADYICLNASDLKILDTGILNYTYTIRVIDAGFNDGYFDDVVKGQTNLYLKNNCFCNE